MLGAAGAQPEPVPLADGEEPVAFLGIADGAPLFAVEREDAELTNLRDLAPALPGDQLGVLAYASGLANWARNTRFCSRCAAPTAIRDGGHMLECANGHQHHPRTDPVVIMLVTDGDRVLLGRQPIWPPGRYSTLAGFVEPGEALETAVAREIREEAGVEVGDVRYVASQPWPFPVSLMLGFHARYVSGEAAPVDAELEDVRWFSRDAVLTSCRHAEEPDWIAGEAADGLIVPPPFAIARHLIERWLADTA